MKVIGVYNQENERHRMGNSPYGVFRVHCILCLAISFQYGA